MDSTPNWHRDPARLTQDREARAAKLSSCNSLNEALDRNVLSEHEDITLSEALVLGLWAQGVRKFLAVFGHGSTEVGEVLRIYQKAGLVQVFPVRSEIEASHAATALRWVTGEKAAVVTSIGPGAMQSFAASLAAASNGIGVWYLVGDETTQDEGYNMQQIPKPRQGLFHGVFEAMGDAYSLHTPPALNTALRRGQKAVDHPTKGSPFFLLLPMNTQNSPLPAFNLRQLLPAQMPASDLCSDLAALEQAAEAIAGSKRTVIRAGGGSRYAGAELQELAELADGVVVTSPVATGVLPYDHPRNMSVGGSKGSICGNFAMYEADLLIAVGSRSVCQSDSSRTNYPNARTVVHINADLDDALHYNHTIPLVGDARAVLHQLNLLLQKHANTSTILSPSDWFSACQKKRQEWEAFKAERYNHPTLRDEKLGKELLTQPAALQIATRWARQLDAVSFFDAGDVQANGFQVVEDDRIGRTYTDTGASYMGFAVSALLAAGITNDPFYGVAFTGDGSFMMNPQILIDGVEHGVSGCIVLLDNRRMAAISGLQDAQYGKVFATDDSVEVDYVALASAVKGIKALDGGTSPESFMAALDEAGSYEGLSLIHVPVYYGDNPLGGLGAFGRWNVGSWVQDTQKLRHEQDL